MNTRKYIARQVFFLQETLLGRKTNAFAREFAKSQWFSLDRLREIQLTKLRKLLEHAYTTVPYYRSVMDKHGCRCDTIQTLDDLQKIPVLTKDVIRDQATQLLSSEAGRLRMRDTCTTGSTGQYLDLQVSAERVAVNNAMEMRNRQWLGADYFGRKLLLWGRPQSGGPVQLFVKGVRDFFLNKKKFTCDSIAPDDARRFAQDVSSWKPEYLYCYAGSAAHMARMLLDQDIQVVVPELKGVVTTAEVLFDYQREILEKAFNVPVFNEYGSAECGLIAHECDYGNMHINAESVIVEVDTGENGSADEGELIITNLHSFGMPIIRYRLGDLGQLSEKQCPCGRGLPLLDSVFGRTVDAMYSRDGKRIDAVVVDTIAEDSSVQAFRIHQKTFTDLEVKLAVADSFDLSFEKRFIKDIESLFGHEMHVIFSYMEESAIVTPGKFRHITSDVKLNDSSF